MKACPTLTLGQQYVTSKAGTYVTVHKPTTLMCDTCQMSYNSYSR